MAAVLAAEKASWTWHVANSPPGLLKRLDRAMLAVFCCAEATYAEATEAMANAALTVPGSVAGTTVPNPLQRIIDRQAMILARLGAELGLSPSARTRIDVPPEHESEDEWAGILD